ncbi:MAG: hypothetical protein PHG34_08760 [Candidatus Cloacimonetes bacterium]|jgi:hypothetical protein|nr:hypothetical protein [Candidatus Cloacimonadota bacterium]
MAGNKRFEQSDFNKYLRKSKTLEVKTQGLRRSDFLVFGLKFLDRSQGQDFQDWEANKILSKALDRISGLCSMTLQQAISSQIVTIYGNGLPPNSRFKIPQNLPDDTEWASIRIQGKERIIGFIENGFVFQVVFLDKEHLFYPSIKKHT